MEKIYKILNYQILLPLLCTQGYGKVILEWLIKQANRAGCKYLELDSGTNRIEAHSFYRRNGLEDIALHFSVPRIGKTNYNSPA